MVSNGRIRELVDIDLQVVNSIHRELPLRNPYNDGAYIYVKEPKFETIQDIKIGLNFKGTKDDHSPKQILI